MEARGSPANIASISRPPGGGCRVAGTRLSWQPRRPQDVIRDGIRAACFSPAVLRLALWATLPSETPGQTGHSRHLQICAITGLSGLDLPPARLTAGIDAEDHQPERDDDQQSRT
jgi:hypothetical protein